MKKLNFIIILFSFTYGFIFSQQNFPNFLEGKWKVEDKESYELWTKHGSNYLKGISYTIKNGEFKLREHLDIKMIDKDILYIPTVIGQKYGKEVALKLKRNGDIFLFENMQHDFPKRIVYRILGKDTLFVEVNDGGQKKFSFKMIKQKKMEKDTTTSNTLYDAALADKLGADELGMKTYFLVLLKTGSNTSTDKDWMQKSFRGHMENINRLVKEGKLIIAGPFLSKNENHYRGIFIMNAKTKEETETILQTDPAIKDKFLESEIYPWFGSAALSEYLDAADKIWKKKP